MEKEIEKKIRKDILSLIVSIFFYIDGGTYSNKKHLIKNRITSDYFLDEIIKIINKYIK